MLQVYLTNYGLLKKVRRSGKKDISTKLKKLVKIMTVDEYLERNPNSKRFAAAVRRMFNELKPVVWVSFIGTSKHDIPHPIHGTIFYKDMSAAEYDELMIINSKFNRIYVQEKRKQQLKEATEQWSI